jgi:hypothetical protein
VERGVAGRGRRIGIAALSLLLGALLLARAVPLVVAEVLKLPGNRVLALMQQGRAPSDKELELFIATRQKSLAWADEARARTDLALADLALAQRQIGGGPRYQELVESAEQSLRQGLALAPANPFAWARLGFGELAAVEPGTRVAAALAMSIRSGRVEPSLTFARLALCLIEWPDFPAADRALIEDQIRLAWSQSPRQLIDLARITKRIDTVRQALDGPDGDRFDQQLAHAEK